MAVDGSIKIQIITDIKEAEKRLKKYESEVEKTAQKIEKVNMQLGAAYQRRDQIAAQNAANFAHLPEGDVRDAAEWGALEKSKEYQQIQAEVQQLEDKMADLNNVLVEQKQRVDEENASLAALNGGLGTTASQEAAVAAGLRQKTQEILMQGDESARAGAEVRRLNDQFKKLNKVNLKDAQRSVTKLKDKLKETRKEADKTPSSIARMAKSFKRLVVAVLILQPIRAALRSIRDGIQDLAKENASVNRSMSEMSTAFNQCKNAITAAFAPAIQALTPLVVTLANALTSLFHMLSMLGNALLLGSGRFVKAKKVQKDYADSLSATAGAAGAAKQALSSLAGFDQLDVLQQPSGGGGTGGGAGGIDLGFEEMFEEVEIPDWLAKGMEGIEPYVDRLRTAVENLKKAFVNLANTPELVAFLKIVKDLLAHYFFSRLIPAGIVALTGAIEILTGWLQFMRGWLDLIIGLLTGDFDRAFNGGKVVIEGFKTALVGLGHLIESVLIYFLGKEAVEAMKTFAAIGISKFVELFGKGEEVTKGLKTLFGGLITFLVGVFTHDWSKAWEGVQTIFKGICDTFGPLMSGGANAVIRVINRLVRAAVNGLNRLIDALNSIQVDIPDWVPGLGGKSFGVNIPKISGFQIPQLAAGAVIPPNAKFLAMLGDQTHGRNLETPEGLMRQIFQEEMARMGGGGVTTINFEGDLAQLVRVLKPYIDRESNRQGRLLVKGAPL